MSASARVTSAIARSQWPGGSRLARIAAASLARASARAGRSVARDTVASFKSVAATCGWVAPSALALGLEGVGQQPLGLGELALGRPHLAQQCGRRRNLGVPRRQDAPPQIECGEGEGLRLVDLAPPQLDPAEVVQRPGHRRVRLAEGRAPYVERCAEQRHGLVEPSPVFEQRRQVVDLHGVVGMRRAQSLLGAGQRQPVEGLGSGQVAGVVQQRRQVVERGRGVGMVVAVGLAPDGQGLAQERLCPRSDPLARCAPVRDGRARCASSG